MSKGERSLPPATQGGRPWAEAVFHVLAHVPTRVAASLWDQEYVRRCAETLGSAAHRPLGEDARVLARLLDDHEVLARVQLLAWLFVEVGRARSVALVDLAALSPDAVDAPELLPALRRAGDAVEILRCAVELEAPLLARLPRVKVDVEPVEVELRRVRRAAPALARFTIRLLAPLRRRGRVRGDEIWVGVPGSGLTIEHVAWQAAHEATVAELSALGDRSEREVEHAALDTLRDRARAVGLEAEHAVWFSHLDHAGGRRSGT